MKNFILPISILSGFFLLASCAGESSQEKKEKEQKKNPFDALAEMSKQMKEGAETSQANQERESHSGIGAIHYKELQKYLPSSLNGYKAGNPTGGTVNMMGMSYSNAEIKFTKEDGGYVKVSILDYNTASSLYAMATGMWAMGMSVDTDDEKAEGIKIDNDITGWETLDKKEKRATIYLGIKNRFLLTVEANQQSNTDFVKSIATSMKLDDLKKI
jgi:hypothetical protein